MKGRLLLIKMNEGEGTLLSSVKRHDPYFSEGDSRLFLEVKGMASPSSQWRGGSFSSEGRNRHFLFKVQVKATPSSH